jgi:hypothetical protein
MAARGAWLAVIRDKTRLILRWRLRNLVCLCSLYCLCKKNQFILFVQEKCFLILYHIHARDIRVCFGWRNDKECSILLSKCFSFFVDGNKISSQAVQVHLDLGHCSGESYCIKRKPYDSVVKELEKISNNLTGDAKIWVWIYIKMIWLADFIVFFTCL